MDKVIKQMISIACKKVQRKPKATNKVNSSFVFIPGNNNIGITVNQEPYVQQSRNEIDLMDSIVSLAQTNTMSKTIY